MKIYKTKHFHKWAKKSGLADEQLKEAITELLKNLSSVSLGAGLFKKRLAQPHRGKSGSFRTLIAYKQEELAIFLYGFEKGDKDNLNRDEELALKRLAKELLKLSTEKLTIATTLKEFFEVK